MRLLRLDEVMCRTGLTRSAIYRLLDAGHFPKSTKLYPGARSIGFVETEIDAWVEARIDGREAAA